MESAQNSAMIDFSSELAVLEGLGKIKEYESSLQNSPSHDNFNGSFSGAQYKMYPIKNKPIFYTPKKTKLVLRKRYSIVPVNPTSNNEANCVSSKSNQNSYYNIQTNFIYRTPENEKKAIQYNAKAMEKSLAIKIMPKLKLSILKLKEKLGLEGQHKYFINDIVLPKIPLVKQKSSKSMLHFKHLLKVNSKPHFSLKI